MLHETVIRPTLVVPADVERDDGRGFLTKLDGLLELSPSETVLDCSRLRDVNSSQIAVLWDARAKCEAAGVPVRLTYVGSGLERVLKVLDLYDLFDVDVQVPQRVIERPEVPAPARVGGDVTVYETTFDASVAGVNRGLEGFRGFLAGLNLPEMCAFELGTVFYEVATNVREHAGLGGTGQMTFTAALEGGKIKLKFMDLGRPFDPEREAPSFSAREAIKRRQNRGIGLYLVRRLMDSLAYERLGDRNVVSLEKLVRHERETQQ